MVGRSIPLNSPLPGIGSYTVDDADNGKAAAYGG
jgi:hypothetical protein